MRVIGNWKMNHGGASCRELARALKSGLALNAGVSVGIAPPFTALETVCSELRGGGIQIGVQNIHWEKAGAFTGEISPDFVKDLGVTFAIIGHSERRQLFGETSELVAKRLQGAVLNGLTGILCIGETLEERETEKTEAVLEAQLKTGLSLLSANDAERIVVAYEPVWAIGTGKTAKPDQVAEVHRFIRDIWKSHFSAGVPLEILYGGSVTPENFGELANLDGVDGALVGGASLKPELFCRLVSIAGEVTCEK